MQKLDDATAHMTFLAMVADLQRAWQVHLDAPDDYFDVVEKVIVDWWEMTGHRVEETPPFKHSPAEYPAFKSCPAEYTSGWGFTFYTLVEQLSEALPPDQLMSAIQLYLLNEEQWRTGSTTQSCRLQRVFATAHPDRDAELVAWVRKNITNYWAHLSFRGREAETYAEYAARRRRWAEEVRAQELKAQEAGGQGAKARRLAEHATSQLYKCVLRGDVAAVKSMLAKGADVDAVEAEHGPLEAIARANGRGKMVEYLETGAKP